MAIGKAVDWQLMIDDCYGGGHESYDDVDP